ncbi:MAG: hypothetical protein ACLTSZ_06950 [Lachnospiraceae bacterium]
MKRSWGRRRKQCRFRQTSDAKTEALRGADCAWVFGKRCIKGSAKAGVTEDMDTETILKLALKQISFL